MAQSISPPPSPQPPSRSPNLKAALGVLLFRLILLGLGGGGSIVLGVAIAFWQPGTIQEPPMLERGLRWLTAWRNGEWYQWSSSTPDVGSLPLDVALTPPTGLPSRAFPPTSSTPSSPNSGAPPAESSDAAQEHSAALSDAPSASGDGAAPNDELAQLQADLAEVRDRLQTLEDQLNLAPPSAETDLPSIEERLARIEAEVSDTPESTSDGQPLARPTPPSDPVSPPVISLASPPILAEPAGSLSHGSPPFPVPLSSNALRVTLPSDALFDGDSNQLKPSAYPLLDSIAEELKTFSSATIRVSVHTDDVASSESNRALALARSQEICSHLSPQLGDSYRWVVIGYGESRPLITGDSPFAQERNRRIEITIEPN